MNLLVDIGNTRIKWAFWTQGEPLYVSAAVHRGSDLDALFTTLWGKGSRPREVLVSNVAGILVAEVLKRWVRTHWNVSTQFLASGKKQGGIQNGYHKPHALGIDRWLAMIGARQSAPGPLCVVDCGTAMTIDVVTGKGEHLGGFILPGLTRLQTAPREDCPHLPPPSALSPTAAGAFLAKFLAQNTHSAIIVGALFMAVATIERVLEELFRQFDTPSTPVITGGDALQLLAYLPENCQHRPDLVLEGMCAIIDG